MWYTILSWGVVYDTALGECGARYCPGGLWCTILPWGGVVYDTAQGECGVGYCPGGAWCTILPWGGCSVRYYLQARYYLQVGGLERLCII